jgi:hypothetical protein
MAVKHMIQQLKEQIVAANKAAAHYGTLSKQKYEEAGQLTQVLEKMEGLPDAVKGTTPRVNKGGEHPKTAAAKARLLGILKKHEGKVRCAKINSEYSMGYGTQYSLAERYPKMFQMREENGHETMRLLEEPAEEPTT